MKYEIRELSIGGILDQAIKVLVDNLGVLLAIGFALQLPLALVTVGLMSMNQFDPNDPAAFQAADPSFFIGLAVVGLLSILVTPITNAALVHAVSDAYLGKKPSVGAAFSRAISRIGPLIFTWILVGLAIMGGLILCIIPGILCMFWFALATQVVVLEPKSGTAALKRSKELMKGNIGKWFVLIILMAVLGGGLGMGTQLIASISGSPLVAQLLNSLAQILAGLLGGAIIVVFYFSARCSHENFDLELLATSFDGATSSDDLYDSEDEEF